MNLKPTIQELEQEQHQLLRRVEDIKEVLAGLYLLSKDSQVPRLQFKQAKKSLVIVPALKARQTRLESKLEPQRKHHRWKKACLNCGKKYFTKRPRASKFHSSRCRSEWARMLKRGDKQVSQTPGPAPKAVMDPNSRAGKTMQAIQSGANITRKGIQRTLAQNYSLYCQNPACGKSFRASKPWARWCPDCWRSHHALTKKYPLPKGMAYRMTADKPPITAKTVDPLKPTKLMPGDPLRAGGPDATGH